MSLDTRYMFLEFVESLSGLELCHALTSVSMKSGQDPRLFLSDKQSAFIILKHELISKLGSKENELRQKGIFLVSPGGNHQFLGFLERQIGEVIQIYRYQI